MELVKKIRLNAVLNAILTIVVGLLFVIKPYGASSTVAVIAGIIILCNGVFDIIRYFTASEYAFFIRESLFTGIIKIVLGIFIITHTGGTMVILSYIFSIFIVVNGVTCLEGAIQLKKAGIPSWKISAVLAVLITAAGIFTLLWPFSAVSAAAMCIGIVLMVDGITELITIHQLKKIGKEFYRSVKLMKDEMDGNIIDQ